MAVQLDQSLFASKLRYDDDLVEEDFTTLRALIAKRREQQRKLQQAEEDERNRIAKLKKARAGTKGVITISANQTKPVNFTFTSKGKLLYKSKVNVENLPEQTT